MSRFLLFCLVLVTLPACAVTYPVTDNFPGFGPLSSNWTNTTVPNEGYVPLQQAGGTVVPSTSGAQGLAVYTGVTFISDQYSEVRITRNGASGSTGPCVRMTPAGDGVCYISQFGEVYLVGNGTGRGLVVGGCPIPSSGDIIKLSVEGTNYTCADVTTGASATGSDSTYPTGSPAILVDQRPSTANALAQFQADCIPTCATAAGGVITFTPPAGTFVMPQSVSLSTTIPQAIIYYTTDGSAATTASNVYTKPITVSSSQVINAIAVAAGSAAYVINLAAAEAPQISPAGGTFEGPQTVELGTTTPLATIYYTTDGSIPNTSSNVYTGPITVSTSKTISAITIAPGFAPSAVTTATYTITGSPTGQRWYVNEHGGTRYSVNVTNGQCNGKSAAPYPGTGVNQDCAFNDIRYLWTDGSYTTDYHAGSPTWGWIGASGDTYLIDCSGRTSCRIGQNGPNSNDGFGLFGLPNSAGAPKPISGTSEAHTRILGINYANCSMPDAKAHVNGGFSVTWVFDLTATSYVDFACFDITDFSSCGLSGQSNTCQRSFPLDDFARNGLMLNNQTTHVSITDVNIHGMAANGMLGATGNGVSVTRVTVAGNASSGWDMDDDSGTTGMGLLALSYFKTLWNGCAEEFPIVHALPYADCTDSFSGGFGDGLGTATVDSVVPWIMTIDHSIAAYNTQDGFDLLHLQRGGSNLQVSASLMYGNMGQQLKMGDAGVAFNNLIVGNCNALRQDIPGTPAGYNSRLSNFCRANDVAVLLAVNDGGLTTRYLYNTLYTAGTIGVDVTTLGPCTTTCFLDFQNNVFVGFLNNAENGYPSGGRGIYPTPIFFDNGQILSLPGSSFTNNVTFNPRSNWTCPQISWNEQNAICTEPGLVDETFHLYGFGNMSPINSNSAVVGRAIPIPLVKEDIVGNPRSTTTPTIGAYEMKSTVQDLPK